MPGAPSSVTADFPPMVHHEARILQLHVGASGGGPTHELPAYILKATTSRERNAFAAVATSVAGRPHFSPPTGRWRQAAADG